MKTITLPNGKVTVYYTSIKNTPAQVELLIKQMIAMDSNVGFDIDKLRAAASVCQEMIALEKKAEAIGWVQNFFQSIFYATQKIDFLQVAFALMTIDKETYKRFGYEIPDEFLQAKIKELESLGITFETMQSEVSFFLHN